MATTTTVGTTATLPPSTPAAVTVPPEELAAYPGLILLIGTAFVMVIWYMGMSHIKYIRLHTWSSLTLAVSIFCAVTSNNFFNFVVNKMVGIESNTIASAASLLVAYWIVGAGILYCVKTSTLRLKSYGTILGHIMGFQATSLWTLVCQHDPFNQSAWYIVPVVFLIYCVAMSVFVLAFSFFGKVASKSLSKADKERWHDQSQDTGTDFICLGMSFLFCTWMKFLIFGQLDPALSDPADANEYSSTNIAILLTCAICLMIFGGALSVISHTTKCNMLCDVVTTVAATTAAMCLIDVFNWAYLKSEPIESVGRMKIAFYVTMISVVAIVKLGIAGHCCLGRNTKALRGMFTGLGVAVGSSWEKTFDASVDGLDGFGITEWQKALIGYSLFWVVFPAWVAFILPKGDDDLRAENKPNRPVWSFICDNSPCEESAEPIEVGDIIVLKSAEECKASFQRHGRYIWDPLMAQGMCGETFEVLGVEGPWIAVEVPRTIQENATAGYGSYQGKETWFFHEDAADKTKEDEDDYERGDGESEDE